MEEGELVEREVFIEKIQDEDLEVEVVVIVERERSFEDIQMEEINMTDYPSLEYYENEVMDLLERVKSAEETLKNLKNSQVFNGISLFSDLFYHFPTYEVVR